MGSCVSVHKDPTSVVKLQLPIDGDITVSVNAVDCTVADVALTSELSPARYIHSGSKDEAFFDSQPWLESDCEDDFLSVNGDFTPSRGNTPVHHSFSPGHAHPRASNARLIDQTLVSSLPEPSSPVKKILLYELFKESLRDNEYADVGTKAENQIETLSKVVPVSTILTQRQKSTNGTPYPSRTSSERTPDGALGEEDNNAFMSGQCCLPRLISTRSFNERKKSTKCAQKVG